MTVSPLAETLLADAASLRRLAQSLLAAGEGPLVRITLR